MVMEAYNSGLVAHPERSLAGKFFTSLLPPSFERTESTLRQQWKLSGGLKVFPLEKDIILFEFEANRDKEKIINNGPWNVDGILLVLKECTQETSMSDIDFSVACFWVKALGLPYFCYTEEVAEKIGKKLSDEPLIAFKYESSERCFWVKAEINLKKPLPPGLNIGRGRRRKFIQFKYKNLAEFCEHCGMISHRKCGKVAEERALTRKIKTYVYGPWLRYDPKLVGNGLPVKPHYSQSYDDMGLEYEETLTYAQFMVEIHVDVVYASEHEWDGKKLTRSFLRSKYDCHFRFPCYPTRVIKDVLAFEVDRISGQARLTEHDKASIVHGLVDHLMKQRRTWSKQRWVPLIVQVKKKIMVQHMDMESILQELKDKKLRCIVCFKIMKRVYTLSDKSDDILKRICHDAIDEVGLTKVPDFYIRMLMRWVKKSNYFSPKVSKTLHPDNKCVTVLGPDMDSFDRCCICQEDFFLGEEATFTYPCSHVFHTHCIEHVIKTSQDSQRCPLCRIQLLVSST